MTPQVVLLRGINLAGRNRIAMAALREALADSGFEGVRTYLQSGNVALSSPDGPERVAASCEQVIQDRFGLDIEVVVRTRDELAEVVERSPLAAVATDPRRYVVTFLAAEPDPDVIAKASALATQDEQLVHAGRELYVWHADGIGRSKLAAMLSGPKLGVTATARNWATVTKLLSLAG